MGIPILILGESGTGKSASMRNFAADEFALVNVAGKPLPFKGGANESLDSDSYRQIKKFIKECAANVVVVDDAQYLMANEFMRRSSERGYDKFTEIGVNFWDLVRSVIELPKEKIVVFMSHIDRDQNGNEKIKTIGKLLDEKITVEGMFTIVLKTVVKDGHYSFQTQNSGHDTVKSPIGLFAANEIDNDLKAVIESVQEYYGLTEKPVKRAQEEPKKESEAEEEKPKTRRRARKTDEDDLPFDLDGIPENKVDDPFETEEKKEDEQPKEEAPKERKRRIRKER